MPSEVVYGHRAVLAILERRPEDVLRIAYGADAEIDRKALERFARSRSIPLDALDEQALRRATGSTHHEGVVVQTRPRRWLPAQSLADRLLAGEVGGIALDRVRNPYNVGAILRSAAFFGIDAALLGSPAPHPALAPDAIRVAEGGAEHIALARTTDLADTLARLRSRGIAIVGADGSSGASAIGFDFARPTVLVFGHEREGLAPRVREQCDAVVAIPGAGSVESLNVAVAASILMVEMSRRRFVESVRAR